MIDFWIRGFRFGFLLWKRWILATRVQIRSRFYLWLDVNLVFDAAHPPSFVSVQEISKNFTRTIVKPMQDPCAIADSSEPGIFLVYSYSPTGLKLRMVSAWFLRLLTPKKHNLTLRFDESGMFFATESVPQESAPLFLSAKAAEYSTLSRLRISLRDRLTSRLVSNSSSKL